MLDSLGVEVFTIEMQLGKDLVKSDIMREPVAFKKIDSNKRLTPIEALASSLNFYGRVDMDYLMQSTDSTKEEIIGDLKGEIFYNPAIGEWEHKGKFLSGNVITKCKEIGSYLSELTDREKDWTETAVRALVDATPEAIPYEELDINMGERWIDTKLYADFATELFKVETSVMYFDVERHLHGTSAKLLLRWLTTPISSATITVRICLFMPCMILYPKLRKRYTAMVIRCVYRTRKPYKRQPPRYRRLETVSTAGLTGSR